MTPCLAPLPIPSPVTARRIHVRDVRPGMTIRLRHCEGEVKKVWLDEVGDGLVNLRVNGKILILHRYMRVGVE